MIENVIETTENCRFCLMCRHIAPIGHLTGHEALTPHGIALTVASQRRGLIEWHDETVAIAYSEEDGGNCRAHCVFDQPLPAAMAAVRAELVANDLAPQSVYEVHEQLQQYGTPFATQRPLPSSATTTGEVALFVGDEAAYLWPETVTAVTTLLRKTGIEPVLIGHGRSNGFLAGSLGFPETAVAQVQETLAELHDCGAKTMLVLSPGDYFAFNQAHDERLGIPWPADVALLEVVTWLTRKYKSGAISFKTSNSNTPFAYVDPTHAVRVPERVNDVRDLVTAVLSDPPLELFWRRDRAHPVGSTHLQFSRPDLAAQLTHARLQDAQNCGAQTLICEDPATLYHLKRYAAEYGLTLVNLYELLADNLNSAIS